jgi:membrane-associated protein
MSSLALIADYASGQTQVIAAPKLLSATYLLDNFGLAGLLLIVFAECGLLIGFFLPGDSLLFTAGLLVAAGTFHVPFWLLLVTVPIAAIAGNLVGYWIGRTVGPPLFDKPDSRLFKRKYVDQTHEFFDARGPFAIIAARFVPIVRTFVTVIAGVGRMDFRRFAIYSAIGGVLWGVGVTTAGYFLGKIDFVAKHVEVILVLIVLISLIPIAMEYLKARRRAGAAS